MAYRDDEDNLRARVNRLEERAAQADNLQDENRELRRRLQASGGAPQPPHQTNHRDQSLVAWRDQTLPPARRYQSPSQQLNVRAPCAPTRATSDAERQGLAMVALVAFLGCALMAVIGPFIAPRAAAPLLCPSGYTRSYQHVTMHMEAGVLTNDVDLMCVTSSGDVSVDNVKLFGLWGCAGLGCFLSVGAALAIAERRMSRRRPGTNS